jgi:hypothetical protein
MLDCLAPQTGFALAAGWLTALVAFSGLAPQARNPDALDQGFPQQITMTDVGQTPANDKDGLPAAAEHANGGKTE